MVSASSRESLSDYDFPHAVSWKPTRRNRQIRCSLLPDFGTSRIRPLVSLQTLDDSELIDVSGVDCAIGGFTAFEVTAGFGDGVFGLRLQDDDLEPPKADSPASTRCRRSSPSGADPPTPLEILAAASVVVAIVVKERSLLDEVRSRCRRDWD